MDRWIVHVRAVEGLLHGGRLECVSSTFVNEQNARDYAAAMTEGYSSTDTKVESHVYGPGVRVELSPACDAWMRGSQFGTIEQVYADGSISVTLDKPLPLRKSIAVVSARYLQRALT